MPEAATEWWGKAGQRSLERSALVEAVAQLTRALDQIATLPATPALRREAIKLQVALITPLASATARPHEPEQRHRLRHTSEFMAAALLGNEKTGDLVLHPRCHNDHAWLCQRLHPRRGVGRIAVNLARRIDHYRAGFDADAPDRSDRILSGRYEWRDRASPSES